MIQVKPGDWVHVKHDVYGSLQGFVRDNDHQREMICLYIKRASSTFKQSKRIWPEGNHFGWSKLELITHNEVDHRKKLFKQTA